MAATVDTEHPTEPESRQTAHSDAGHIDSEVSDSFSVDLSTAAPSRGLDVPINKKVNVVPDQRGVDDLHLLFPHVGTEVLARLLQYYGSFTAAVDVLRALGDQLEKRRPISARFWDRQYWPRPGQLPSVFSWSVVDSVESYDVVHGHDVEKEEEEEWLDDMDEHEFDEILRKAAAASSADHSFEQVSPVTPKVEPSCSSTPTARYSEVLQRTPKAFASAAPRIPPLVHLYPMRTIAEHEELDVSSDSEDDGIDSILHREWYMMKGMVSATRKNDKLHVDPDVLAKKQRRLAQRAAAMR
jgi:hypothetical protein